MIFGELQANYDSSFDIQRNLNVIYNFLFPRFQICEYKCLYCN
jgi:hypothetical protein